MNISSRTPEGEPNCCPICGAQVIIEPSSGTRDAPCPQCGHLLWWLQTRFSDRLPDDISADTLLSDISGDSLDTVELVMELEEEFDIEVPEDDLENIKTLGDAIRYIQRRRKKE